MNLYEARPLAERSMLSFVTVCKGTCSEPDSGPIFSVERFIKGSFMTISQTNASSATDLALLLQTLNSKTNSTSSSSSTATSSSSASDSTSMSGPGQLFAELEKLSKSDPSEFKTITASIAKELKSAASSSTNSDQASQLNQMASSFATASKSGNFSDLLPSQSSGSGAPPAPPSGSASGAYSQNSSNPLESIFSKALQQINSDLSGSSSTTS